MTLPTLSVISSSSANSTSLPKIEKPSIPAVLAENLYLCYEALVAKAFIDKRELALVSAWIKDLATLAAGRTR